jgi:hypothetical protein
LIREILNAEKQLAVTSDCWHVIHARWSGAPGTPRFIRSIVSEHEDSASAVKAAKDLKGSLARAMGSRPKEARDQVIVRRPASESLKNDGRLAKAPK